MTLNLFVANAKAGIESLAELAKEVEHEEKETAQRGALLKKTRMGLGHGCLYA